MKLRLYLSIVLFGLGWLSVPVSAATLVSYQFSSGSLSPTVTGTGVTATNVTGVSGAVSSQYAYTGMSSSAYNNLTSSGVFGQFALSAASGGDLLDLSSISFSYDFYQTSGTDDPKDMGFVLYFSQDNWSTQTFLQSFTNTSSRTYTPVSSGAINLTGIADLSSISFRIYQDNPVNQSNGLYRFIFDNVVVMGEIIAVPEPSVSVLAALGFGALLARKRTRAGRH